MLLERTWWSLTIEVLGTIEYLRNIIWLIFPNFETQHLHFLVALILGSGYWQHQKYVGILVVNINELISFIHNLLLQVDTPKSHCKWKNNYAWSSTQPNSQVLKDSKASTKYWCAYIPHTENQAWMNYLNSMVYCLQVSNLTDTWPARDSDKRYFWESPISKSSNLHLLARAPPSHLP